jgi:hypothetical protein
MLGYFIRLGDKTSCGGKVVSATSRIIHHGLNLSRVGDKVTCGKNEGVFNLFGGIQNYTCDGIPCIGTLESFAGCPCRSRLFASEFSSSYEPPRNIKSQNTITTEPEQHAQSTKRLSSYTTGETSESGFISDYPAVLINTHQLPDDQVRLMINANSTTVMLITVEECCDVLSEWGALKKGWISITQTEPGQIAINYGLNIKDFITTGVLIKNLGGFGVTATVFVNEKGTELIKISGYAGVRKVLNAPVFSLRNPKVITLGIGKYGLKNAIKEGGLLTIYVATAYRTLDYILNNETTLATFIGSLATDIVKVGIVSGVSWVAGSAATMLPFIAGPLVIVVVTSIGIAMLLNYIDDEYQITNQVIDYIESAQQEFAGKAREIGTEVWDLGEMHVAGKLIEGVEVIESEIRKYLKDSIKNVNPRYL